LVVDTLLFWFSSGGNGWWVVVGVMVGGSVVGVMHQKENPNLHVH